MPDDDINNVLKGHHEKSITDMINISNIFFFQRKLSADKELKFLFKIKRFEENVKIVH